MGEAETLSAMPGFRRLRLNPNVRTSPRLQTCRLCERVPGKSVRAQAAGQEGGHLDSAYKSARSSLSLSLSLSLSSPGLLTDTVIC